MCVCVYHAGQGCFLGDIKVPSMRKWIPGIVTQNDVTAKELQTTTAQKLAQKLLSLFFTKEQMAKGICTDSVDRERLNPYSVDGICCKLYILACLLCVQLCITY